MAELHESEIDVDPFKQFRGWLDQAVAAQLPQPYAMTLATATRDGKPSARVVLLRGSDEKGFLFYTNYESRKGAELDANPVAALVFYWPQLDRQIRIEGRIERVSSENSDVYFQSRPRGSRLGAWASRQSQVVPNREFLDRRMEQLTSEYRQGHIPRPPYWGGYRLVPHLFEFWQERPNRMHDRLRYRLQEGRWVIDRLAP